MMTDRNVYFANASMTKQNGGALHCVGPVRNWIFSLLTSAMRCQLTKLL